MLGLDCSLRLSFFHSVWKKNEFRKGHPEECSSRNGLPEQPIAVSFGGNPIEIGMHAHQHAHFTCKTQAVFNLVDIHWFLPEAIACE